MLLDFFPASPLSILTPMRPEHRIQLNTQYSHIVWLHTGQLEKKRQRYTRHSQWSNHGMLRFLLWWLLLLILVPCWLFYLTIFRSLSLSFVLLHHVAKIQLSLAHTFRGIRCLLSCKHPGDIIGIGKENWDLLKTLDKANNLTVLFSHCKFQSWGKQCAPWM